ncbi:hypothetical protein EDB86DRAFT_2824578 [Lactarius hatsudake]|nr:hypothetical protein EDB86DRAFT_2824578 [Lactarius hatsudake]
MPRVTRSQEHSKKQPDFCVLIDKTSRNTVNKPVPTTEKTSEKPKKKATKAPRVTTKSKAKVKASSKSLPLQVDDEDAAPPAGVGGLDDPFQLVLSARPGGFATPPQSHPPPRPPKRPEPHSHDPMTTLPPRYDDGTPSPEPARRRSRHVGDRASLLPPSSPIHLSSSPVRQTHNHDGDGGSIFPSVLRPWSPSQFHTPTRNNRKRKRTPLSQPQLQSEGEMNNDDLFAYGVVDDLDEREESVAWENAGSDKENLGGPQGSDDIADNKHPPSMPIASERGILQPRDVSLSPTRSGDSDPFGFFATERLLKARRAEKMVADTEAGPSNTRRGPRLPFGELTAAEVVPPTIASESVPLPRSPSQSPPRPASPYRRYSDSEIEDLYAPASPPHTPRSRLPHVQATSPHDEATPVVAPDPLTPRNGDSARTFTMRRRRQKELHRVSEHGSEIEGSSAPSSPSPVKRVHQRPPEPESQIDYKDNQGSEEEEGERERLPKKARLRGKGGGKENAGRKGPTAEDPLEAARRVLENAPRRRPARRTTATRKSKASSNLEGVNGGHEERRQPTRGRGATRSASGRVTRSRGGSKTSRSRKKKVDESTPEDVSEKREQERLKRVEYFKQLDGYELRKENVAEVMTAAYGSGGLHICVSLLLNWVRTDKPILVDIVQQRSHGAAIFEYEIRSRWTVGQWQFKYYRFASPSETEGGTLSAGLLIHMVASL